MRWPGRVADGHSCIQDEYCFSRPNRTRNDNLVDFTALLYRQGKGRLPLTTTSTTSTPRKDCPWMILLSTSPEQGHPRPGYAIPSGSRRPEYLGDRCYESDCDR